jgi:hypothetical protein
MKKAILIATLLIAAFSVAACGSRSKTTSNTSVTTTTTGQQLTDLKAALDAGAITPDEYEKKRKDILKNG